MELKNNTTLKGHTAAVYALCQGEEDHLIFSGGSDRHVILWNLESLTAEKVVAKSPTTIISLLYIKEFNYLLIGQVEGGVHVIDLKLGKEVKYLKQHQGYIFDIKYISSKKELLIASADGAISIWSMVDFKLLYHRKMCEGKIRKVDVSANEKQVALALGDYSVSILSSKDWSEVSRITAFSSPINVVRFSSKKNELLAGEKDAHLYQFHAKSQEIENKIAAHNWAIYDIQFSPDARFFATASRDKTIKIWDPLAMKVLKRFEGIKDSAHTHSVNALFWSNYKNYLISVGDDTAVKVWQLLD